MEVELKLNFSKSSVSKTVYLAEIEGRFIVVFPAASTVQYSEVKSCNSSCIQASIPLIFWLVDAKVCSKLVFSSWNLGIISWRIKLRWYFVDSLDESSRQASLLATTKSKIASWLAKDSGRIKLPDLIGIPWNPAIPVPRTRLMSIVSALSN